MDIFFEGLNNLMGIICVCVFADGLQGLSKAFHYHTIFYFLFASLKMLTETLLKIPFSEIGRCSLVPTSHWLQGKCARINLSQAVSNMILQNHRRLPESIFNVKIAALGLILSSIVKTINS